MKCLEKIEDFENEIQKDFMLVDFYADWCGPCQALGIVLRSLEDIPILKVNTDAFPKLAEKYGVMSIPTLIQFKNGVEVSKKIGTMSKEELMSWLKE